MNDLPVRLNTLLDYLLNYAPPHRFLPMVIERIELLITKYENSKTITEEIINLSLGLGLYISEDYYFTESETGEKIFDVINYIARSK